MMTNNIHKTAIIDSKAKIGDNVQIGPYTIIEGPVRVGNGASILAGTYIIGDVTIGEGTIVHMGVVLGHQPQDKESVEKGTYGGLKIGKNNVIREYVSIHSSKYEDGYTLVGDNNYLMAFSHLGHDCKVSNNVVICNNSLMAGHIEIEDNVFISGNCVVHQFVRLGKYCFIAGQSRIGQDVPPFMIAVLNSHITRVNVIGMRRAGYSSKNITSAIRAFKILYKQGLSVKSAVELIQDQDDPISKYIVSFIKMSKRGICNQEEDKYGLGQKNSGGDTFVPKPDISATDRLCKDSDLC